MSEQQQKEVINLIEIHLAGKVARNDSAQFGLIMANATKRYGKIRSFDQLYMDKARQYVLRDARN